MGKTKKVIKRKLKLNKTTKKRINQRKKSKRISRKYQGRGGNKPLEKVNLQQMFYKIFSDAIEQEGGYDKMEDTSLVPKYNDMLSKWLKGTTSEKDKMNKEIEKLRIYVVGKLYKLFQGKYPRDYIDHVVDMERPEVLMEMYLSSIYPFSREYDFGYDEYPEEEKPYNKFRIDVIEPKYPGNKPMQKWQMVKNYVSPVGRNFIGRKIWANGNILSLDELEFWLYVFKIRKAHQGSSLVPKIFKYPGMEGTPEQLQEVIDQIQQEIDDYTF